MSQVSLNSLFQIPENTICADCRRKDPRWASHNLGVFICIGCSGIHRSLGTHISKVKSIDLDKWTEDQLKNMVKWGNARANKYWEAKLPADFQPPESGIESFIRAKYERKQYALHSRTPDPETLDNLKSENHSNKSTAEKSKKTTKGTKNVKNRTTDEAPTKTAIPSGLQGMNVFNFEDQRKEPRALSTQKSPILPELPKEVPLSPQRSLQKGRMLVPTNITLSGSEFFFTKDTKPSQHQSSSKSLTEKEFTNGTESKLAPKNEDETLAVSDEHVPIMSTNDDRSPSFSLEKEHSSNEVVSSEPTAVLNTSNNSHPYPPIPEDLLDAIPKW
ncbi:ARF GAP with effector function(s) [Basidiobolus ranarum]|uniref:ARF GAP with effector function(S) n=1 Tax=Basidiobolus ranarum TaxID=34480 RepID=A0ABR2WDE6_9FUNG